MSYLVTKTFLNSYRKVFIIRAVIDLLKIQHDILQLGEIRGKLNCIRNSYFTVRSFSKLSLSCCEVEDATRCYEIIFKVLFNFMKSQRVL